ncbi:endo-1,4-beta-xylanase [Ruminiclostridium josui]|uniref:Beta-xylanase n=1 Tax=Ruminiclostridium josui TaxID=1499 RepID=A0A173M083_RUMJO|nr:endo-1,4-beta-xylanase [Ruminiclostridium josui]BAV00621.1 xylanase [Ruminiclostridium josui JCM 17888]
MIKKSNNCKLRIFSILLSALLCACIINSSLPLTADAAMATGKPKFVGNIWYDGSVPSKFGDYWNQLTPENATKWGSCEPQQGVYNFSQAKAMYNYCKTNKIPFKFHTLVWGSQYPNWLNNLSGAARKTAIENWYKAAAQNFPDPEFIDVVNEAMPGHAPFPFKNDIGGDNGLYGTGWDWIVWSFEMARKYFPNAKLLINDYNVLNEWSCLDQYIPVVKILKARNLIDGVGCQSHGLEKTSAANLKSRLDRLAATGVPIYISELDLDIADDNAQKSKMQELFPVMYEHSAVKGITIWGYIQGRTWIQNSHLIRSNGTERPALTWLKQYLANVPGEDIPVEPRSAFEKIEAESYNDQSGIQTETCSEGGENVGYIEDGDYIVYKSIDFGNGATSFKARVASATNGGKIEIRLDSANGTLIGTCPVAATGDWQTWVDATCSVSGVSGKHDLYLKFTGGSDYLFNINWFIFGNTPVSTDKIGDLNSDGEIDALDFQILKKCILGTETVKNEKLADLDGSGAIDALDFVLMKQYLLGQITKFPADK